MTFTRINTVNTDCCVSSDCCASTVCNLYCMRSWNSNIPFVLA